MQITRKLYDVFEEISVNRKCNYYLNNYSFRILYPYGGCGKHFNPCIIMDINSVNAIISVGPILSKRTMTFHFKSLTEIPFYSFIENSNLIKKLRVVLIEQLKRI